MSRHILLTFILVTALASTAQDSSQVKNKYKWITRIKPDTLATMLNMDAVYNRPFLQLGKVPVALGGYIETNTSYFRTDGISEGWSFQIPRLTLFVSATVKNRIKFLTEIEFEEGGIHRITEHEEVGIRSLGFRLLAFALLVRFCFFLS